MKLLLAALDLLLGVLQQHVNHAAGTVPGLALERGVTEDEHSAALKLLEVRLPSCICTRTATIVVSPAVAESPLYRTVTALT